MYQILNDEIEREFGTLGDLLAFMNKDTTRFGTEGFCPSRTEYVLRDGQPVKLVSNTYGRHGIQQEGSAFDNLIAMLDEIELHYVRNGSIVRKPHEMSRDAWAAVTAIGSAAYDVFPCFSDEQKRERRETVGLNGDTLVAALSLFCNIEFMKRFGYGHNGPSYDRTGQTNSRHEVHVAYALAAGKFVPELVLQDYRANPALQGKYDIQKWFKALLDIPQLRGKIPTEKFTVLCSTLRNSNIELTQDNAPEFIRLMAEMRDEPTYVNMDDFLYQRGILPPKTLDKPPVVVDLSTAYSPLALRIRQLISEWRVKNESKRIDEQRASGIATLREMGLVKEQIARFMDEEPLDWCNKMARAVDLKNIALLLDILDTSDDHNPYSKKAIQEHCGLKVLGVKAKERRNAIFAFCGFDADQRKNYEQAVLSASSQRKKQRDIDEAVKCASQAQWRVDGGKIVSGKGYVDAAFAEGYTVIATRRKGSALQYWLKNPVNGALRNILVKDGTLAYARVVLGLEDEKVPLAA